MSEEEARKFKISIRKEVRHGGLILTIVVSLSYEGKVVSTDCIDIAS